MALWLTVDFYHPLKAWQPILYFGIGLFWAFHLTFTASMLHQRQTDLSSQGYVFSGVIILLTNLGLVLLLLSFLTHDGIVGAIRLLGGQAVQSYSWTWHQLARGVQVAQTAWQQHSF
jgi:TM2 domain-containing membrane protein YozV